LGCGTSSSIPQPLSIQLEIMIRRLLDGRLHGIFIGLDRIGSVVRRNSGKQPLFAAYMSTLGSR
jgi:hypothetical protein